MFGNSVSISVSADTIAPADPASCDDDLRERPERCAAFAVAATPARRLAGNYAILTAGEVAAKLATFAAFAYLGRTLGTSRYGDLEFVLASMTFFTLPVDLGLGVYGAREIAQRPGKAARLVRDVAMLRLALAVAAFIAVLAFLPLVAARRGSEAAGLLLVYGCSLFLAPALLQWLFQGRDRMNWVAAASIARNGIFALLVLALVRVQTPLYAIGLIECAAVAAVGAMCVALARWRLRIAIPSRSFRWKVLAQRLRTAAPIGLGEIAWALLWYFPTVQLGLAAEQESLGTFGASHRLVMAAHTFVWLYFFNLLPSIARCAVGSGPPLADLVRRSLVPALWGSLLVAGLTTMLSGWLLATIFGSDFARADAVLAALIWVIPMAALSGHFRYTLIAFDRQRVEFVCTLVAAMFSVALGWILTPIYGTVGAAYALVAAVAVNLALAYFFMCRYVAVIPVLSSLMKPIAAMLVAAGAFALLRTRGPWGATAIAAAIYVAMFVVCERRELGTLLARGTR